MFWAFIVYRKRKNGPLYPKQTKENLPLELIYTAVPFLMVGVLFYFTVTTENFVLESEPDPDVTIERHRVQVELGLRLPGHHRPRTAARCTPSAPARRSRSWCCRSNQVIQYELRSKDVIHSFWTIDFLFKRDVFPYPEENQTENIFQNTIEQTGAFVGRCAELCGTYHCAMNFEVRAVPAGRLRRLHRLPRSR